MFVILLVPLGRICGVDGAELDVIERHAGPAKCMDRIAG